MDYQKTSLKPRIAFAIRRLELQKQKLEQAIERFTQRDKAIFARIVDAHTKHDKSRATVFSNELVEIRKMTKIIIKAHLGLEYAIECLRKIDPTDEAYAAHLLNVISLTETVVILKNVRAELVSIFPEAENELGEIGNGLSGVMVEVGQNAGVPLNFNEIKESISKIMTGITAAAEQKMKDKYPEVPSGFV